MFKGGPDAVVREAEARASVDELTKGLAEDARRAGQLPPLRAIEDLAKQVTAETIARHEDAFRNGTPKAEKVKRKGSAARIDQGPIVDDLGVVTKVERHFDSKRHAKKAKAKAVAAADLIEARLAGERVALLMKFAPGSDGVAQWVYPEWAERIHRAHRETLSLSKNLGLEPGKAESDAADAVLAVLDASNTAFGDWRHPKGSDGKPLYFLPAK